MKILIADDDTELRGLIGYALRQAGWLVIEAADGAEALGRFETEAPDLAILDVSMPRMTGLEVLRKIRAAGARTPVMLLTVRAGEEDQIAGLDQGADDYVTKPFSPRTLLARARVLLRRSGAAPGAPPPEKVGSMLLDAETRSVSVGGGDAVRLTPLEFRLLQFLASNAGRVLPGERLSGHVWGHRGAGDKQLLKQLVRRLRQKIEADPANPAYLVTEQGLGYRFDPEGHSASE